MARNIKDYSTAPSLTNVKLVGFDESTNTMYKVPTTLLPTGGGGGGAYSEVLDLFQSSEGSKDPVYISESVLWGGNIKGGDIIEVFGHITNRLPGEGLWTLERCFCGGTRYIVPNDINEVYGPRPIQHYWKNDESVMSAATIWLDLNPESSTPLVITTDSQYLLGTYYIRRVLYHIK